MLNLAVSRTNRYRLIAILNTTILFCFSLVFSATTWATEGGQTSAVPDWSRIVQAHHDRLDKLNSDQAAIDLFVSAIGPATSLTDAASTLGAKGIPTRMTKDLLLPELTKSAQRLLAALTTLHLSEQLIQTMAENDKPASSVIVSALQVEWLAANGPFPSLTDSIRQMTPADAASTGSQDEKRSAVAIATSLNRLAQEAGQQAMTEWWQLKTWKDRVRVARGQSRLCGTWQWAIHNHQNHHQEQKLSLIFPPPGKSGTGISGLSEIVVLGDIVYLRWEMEGKTQEDSLLFSKEGQRLEGTFVNSQGGWGSISGKRTASCTLQ